MLDHWLYIGLFFVVSMGLPAVAIFMATILAPKKPSPVKNSTYECGIETVGESKIQFRVQYYIYALFFLVFDVEAVFLFPWAVAYNQMTFFAILEGVIFALILFGGLLYAWKKGILTWK
jgi:NADH:ubiquinone oxidoreductase subunit 3 (subunit A)